MKLLRLGTSLRAAGFQTFNSSPSQTFTTSCSRCEPLQILYCGSDDFSVASLRKLNEERLANPELIESIDVVCKPPQRVGRGLKRLREVAIKQVAEELSLPLHQIPTFTGWQPPRSSLIIAVSFGLFVPPRVLSGAKYGGLNVHPSLLPDLRGPAPLHHALLLGRKQVGITLQTLSPMHFDHGKILDQIELAMPRDGECSIQELLSFVTPHAADLLLRSLRKQLHANPALAERHQSSVDGQGLAHAPKVKPEQARVDWKSWSVDRIIRAQRAIAPLWNKLEDLQFILPRGRSAFSDALIDARIQWHGMRALQDCEHWSSLTDRSSANCPGRLDVLSWGGFAVPSSPKTGKALTVAGVWLNGQTFVAVDSVTISGRAKHEDAIAAISALLSLDLKGRS